MRTKNIKIAQLTFRVTLEVDLEAFAGNITSAYEFHVH